MSIPKPAIVAAAAALFFLLHVVTADTETLTSSAHDILAKYGLPRGLLPDSVKTYSIADDGKFEIELEKPCYVKFTNLVYYHKKMTGKLSYGAITDLTGIQAQKLFLWVTVTGIKVVAASNEIEFEVGFLSEMLPAQQFENIPTCKAKACRADLLLGTSVAEV